MDHTGYRGRPWLLPVAGRCHKFGLGNMLDSDVPPPTYKPAKKRNHNNTPTTTNNDLILHILRELAVHLKSIHLLFQYDLSFPHNMSVDSLVI